MNSVHVMLCYGFPGACPWGPHPVDSKVSLNEAHTLPPSQWGHSSIVVTTKDSTTLASYYGIAAAITPYTRHTTRQPAPETTGQGDYSFESEDSSSPRTGNLLLPFSNSIETSLGLPFIASTPTIITSELPTPPPTGGVRSRLGSDVSTVGVPSPSTWITPRTSRSTTTVGLSGMSAPLPWPAVPPAQGMPVHSGQHAPTHVATQPPLAQPAFTAITAQMTTLAQTTTPSISKSEKIFKGI
ncbi:hypothetical protein BDV93DRAFT_558029 [Ceratobasidium sp. AG-I]|nr:hypothetical protein BDV93DRAFT_558029 [Ceratobasidium sp. AG-I]